MKTSRFGVLAAPLLLVPLAMRAPEASPPPPTPAHTYDVHCEVWSATDGELMASLEAYDANGAEAALQVLQSAESGAERLLRVLAPIDQGKSAQFESLSEEPTVQVTASGRGGTQQNFAGYTSSGTSATLTCNPGSSEGTISTSLGLQVSNFSEEGRAIAMVEIHGMWIADGGCVCCQ